MITILHLLGLTIGLTILIKSSDYFVENASQTGKKLGISEILIGLLIVSIGTSLPELATSITSLFTSLNYSEFVIGNILGSNIANVLLVLGFLIFLGGNKIQIKENKIEMLAIVFLSLLFVSLISLEKINYIGGTIILGSYIYYIYYKIKTNQIKENVEKTKEKYLTLITKLIISALFIFLSSKLIVICVEYIAKILLIPQSFITLTIVALGTSLPELFVTFSSIKQKKYAIGLGNILGSNIANIGLIVGISTVIKNFTFNISEFYLGIIFLILSTIMLNLIIIKKPSKKFGLMFLIMYLLYILTYFIFTF